MIKTTLFALVGALAIGGTAWAQANITPDPSPRVPLESGAVVEADREFINAAAAMFDLQQTVNRIAAKRAEAGAVVALAEEMATEYANLDSTLRALAVTVGADVEPNFDVTDMGAVTAARHAGNGSWKTLPETLEQAVAPEVGPAFVRGQLAMHEWLVDLYQTEASATTLDGMNSYAITALVTIQRNQFALRKLAEGFGIPAEASGQPPQYGTAAPPAE